MRRAAANSLVLSAVLGLCACKLPRFQATRERSLEAPAAGIAALVCSTHNGGIDFVGVEGADSVRVRARMGVPGDTQAEADERLAQLDVALQRQGGELTIAGLVPASLAIDSGVWFSYEIEAPPQLALRLQTHNGSVDVRRATGALAVTTHNGSVSAATAADAVDLITHNGAIAIDFAGEGPVQGEVTSHNGAIDIRLGARAAVVDASAHNGDIDASGLQVARLGDHAVQVVAGSGGGRLSVRTHNGGVTLR
jgi:hypothetical protein